MMPTRELRIGDAVTLTAAGLDALIRRLAVDHRVVGPRIADGAIVVRDLASAADLPTGWIDDQEAGRYRLHRDDAAGPFDHVVGPHSLKNFLFPPREPIARFGRVDGEWRELPVDPPERPLAVIGVRGCDLAALAIQDRVFLRGRTEPDGHVDEAYERRRHKLFLVAVDCRRAAPTCFCHSTGSGPAACSAAAGRTADLTLTDLGSGPADAVAPALGERRHACRIGSERGAAVMAAVAAEVFVGHCSADEATAAERVPADLERAMWQRGKEGAGATAGRCLDTGNIRDLLFSNLDHPRWDDVGARCLSCTNCTLVCPTCFCASVTEVADLSGDSVTRERHWESCFSLDHARMHGTSVRHTTASRYRQWLTHKLAGWIDQFGTSGCTGCGRCITWCPVGIDLTAEVAAIRESPSAATGGTS
jgi:ferredoxin